MTWQQKSTDKDSVTFSFRDLDIDTNGAKGIVNRNIHVWLYTVFLVGHQGLKKCSNGTLGVPKRKGIRWLQKKPSSMAPWSNRANLGKMVLAERIFLSQREQVTWSQRRSPQVEVSRSSAPRCSSMEAFRKTSAQVLFSHCTSWWWGQCCCQDFLPVKG